MPIVANAAKKSLEQLSMLLGVPRKNWVSELSTHLKVDRNTISSWFKIDRRIPEKQILAIEAMGYPREQWHIETDDIDEEETGLMAIYIPGFTKDLIALIERHPILGRLILDFDSDNLESAATSMLLWLRQTNRISQENIAIEAGDEMCNQDQNTDIQK